MQDNRYLIGILTGVALTLAVAVIFSVTQPRNAMAQAAGGGPGNASHVTAVTAQYQANQDILYIVDSKEEIVLAYMIHGAGSRGGARSLGKLEFLAARTFKWDKKVEMFNPVGKMGVREVRQQVLKRMESEDK